MIRSPEQIAISKHRENILRLQTYAIFHNFKVDEDMISRLKKACIQFFEENPERSMVPKEILLGVAGVNSAVGAGLGSTGADLVSF